MFRAVVLAVVLVCMALAFGTAPVTAQEPLKLRFGKLGPNLGMARAHVAEAQGFFKKQGLDVEVTQFRASPELNTAVVSGGNALLSYLDFPSHIYDTFFAGVIDLRDIVYHVSLTALFLFVGSSVVETRRWR